MLFGTVGFGLGIPKTKIEVGGLNILKFYLRASPQSAIQRFQVVDLINIGGKSGSFVGGVVETRWFDLNPATSAWAYQPQKLIGTTVQVITAGIVGIKFGKVDLTFKQMNAYNEPITLVDRCCIEAKGVSFSNIKIQGKVQHSAM
jgi:hypothetical protein